MCDINDIFRFRNFNSEEQLEINEIRKKALKNKMSFLKDEKFFIVTQDADKLKSELTLIVPKDWKKDYHEFKKSNSVLNKTDRKTNVLARNGTKIQ